MAKSVLVGKQRPVQEKHAVEMPVMFATKNRHKTATLKYVRLTVYGKNGVTGLIVLLHVKTVSEFEDEQIMKIRVPLVTVPALSQSDAPTF